MGCSKGRSSNRNPPPSHEATATQTTIRLQQDQFATAATLKPRKHQANFQASLLPRKTQKMQKKCDVSWCLPTYYEALTPHGCTNRKIKGSVELLGGERRASTIRPRVRCTKKILPGSKSKTKRLTPVTSCSSQTFSGCVSRSPCNRGALKGVHRAVIFSEKMAGVNAEARFTSTQSHTVVYKELLTTALPGRPRKQAPRVPIAKQAVSVIIEAPSIRRQLLQGQPSSKTLKL